MAGAEAEKRHNPNPAGHDITGSDCFVKNEFHSFFYFWVNKKILLYWS
jgi:hypothetical protein